MGIVKWLMKKKANVFDKSNDHYTTMMVAAEKGHVKVSKLLLKRMVNLNATSASGNSALMLALTAEKEDVAKWLLQEGADVSHRNGEDDDAIDIAEERGMFALKQQLEQKARADTELEAMAARNAAAAAENMR